MIKNGRRRERAALFERFGKLDQHLGLGGCECLAGLCPPLADECLELVVAGLLGAGRGCGEFVVETLCHGGSVLNRVTRAANEVKVTVTEKLVEPCPVLPATSVALALYAWLPSPKE